MLTTLAGVVLGAFALKLILGFMDASLSLPAAFATIAVGNVLPLVTTLGLANAELHGNRVLLPFVGVGASVLMMLFGLAVLAVQAVLVQTLSTGGGSAALGGGAALVPTAALVVLGLGLLGNTGLLSRFLPHGGAPSRRVTSVEQASSYLSHLYAGQAVTCFAGTNGWTYLCYLGGASERTTIGLYIVGSVVRERYLIVPGPLLPPHPTVSPSEYLGAAQQACDQRRLAVSALSHQLLRHPEPARTASARLITIENRFSTRLYMAGRIGGDTIDLRDAATRADELYQTFSTYDAALKSFVADIGRTRMQQDLTSIRGSERFFNGYAQQLGLGCHLP